MKPSIQQEFVSARSNTADCIRLFAPSGGARLEGMRALVFLFFIFAVLGLSSCTRSTIETPERAMRPVEWPLLPADDL
jgi:hypothetical protein